MAFSTRLITQVQFSDGTTADGTRIERALKDFEDRFNRIPKGDLARRFVQTQFVGGWSPARWDAATNNQTCQPFLGIHNQNIPAELIGAVPADGFLNEWRLKGTNNPGITGVGSQYAWSTSFYFRRPVIVIGINLTFFSVTGLYHNTFVWGATPPTGKTTGQPVDDFGIELSVDNPFAIEQRRLNGLEVHKLRFTCDATTISPLGAPGAYLDMLPSVATAPSGQSVDLRGLLIPLHRDTRARLAVWIPEYSNSDASAWQQTGATTYHSWQGQSCSLTLTVLEALQ